MGPTGKARSRERDSVFLIAQVAGPGGATERYRVRNLSREGACIEQPTGLEQGVELVVSIGLIDRILAEVVWTRGAFAGLRFESAIDTMLARKRPPKSLDPQAGWGRANTP